ncbi:MAG: hypothetical protein CL675_07850 [Bdellovibrionaceae bacterium]|nr:hypothetical protein [Pseudobdellovibrionaceae bacterium]
MSCKETFHKADAPIARLIGLVNKHLKSGNTFLLHKGPKDLYQGLSYTPTHKSVANLPLHQFGVSSFYDEFALKQFLRISPTHQVLGSSPTPETSISNYRFGQVRSVEGLPGHTLVGRPSPGDLLFLDHDLAGNYGLLDQLYIVIHSESKHIVEFGELDIFTPSLWPSGDSRTAVQAVSILDLQSRLRLTGNQQILDSIDSIYEQFYHRLQQSGWIEQVNHPSPKALN